MSTKKKTARYNKRQKTQFKETEQVSSIQHGRDVGIITWASKTAMINMVRSLIDKEDIVQGQKSDARREMKVLKKSHFR